MVCSLFLFTKQARTAKEKDMNYIENVFDIHLQWFADVETTETTETVETTETTLEPDDKDNNGQDEGSVTTEMIEKWIESDEGKKWGMSYADKRVTQAIDTFKKKTLPTLLQERENKIREELLPKETPEQKALAELIRKDQEREKQSRKVELENFTIKKANAFGLNIGDQIGFFLKDDEDEIQKHLEWQVLRDKEMLEKGRNIRLRESAHIPESGDEEITPQFKTLKAYQDYMKRTGKPYDSKIYEQIVAYTNRRK